MKHGALVKIRSKEKIFIDKVGLILDSMEMPDGYAWYEVMIENERHWFDEIHLEVLNEDR